jgi:uncharacterized protein YceH (UPF0502 family)
MIYTALIEDLAVEGVSRFVVREHVDKLIGMAKGKTVEHARRKPGESRQDRYARLAREDVLMPERIK